MNKPFPANIKVLSSFEPAETSEGFLHSPNLGNYIAQYQPHLGEMWQNLETATPGSLEEEKAAQMLADFYQLKTGYALQNSGGDSALWADRFNLACEELYGVINPDECIKLIAQDLDEISPAKPSSYVVDIYLEAADAVGQMANSIDIEDEPRSELETPLLQKFSAIPEVINAMPEGQISPSEAREAFQNIIDKLAQSDESWAGWKITNTEGKTMFMVEASEKTIEIPDGRAPLKSKQELLGLAFHELGVHAQRAVNGNKLDDPLMTLGLPNYIDFEEGLGVLFEYMVTGKIPDKITDRYIDIALASGVLGITLSRDELVRLGMSRGKARAKARGQSQPDNAALIKSVTDHVNRIFRGGDGMAVYNEHGEIVTQPVFNKDMVYYQGFVKARDFVSRQLELGKTFEEVFDFLLSGKFDPTNYRHAKYLKEKHKIEL